MKNFKKTVVSVGALSLVALFYFLPSRASEFSSQVVKPDTAYFKGCWGSGNFNKSCSDGGATVMGFQPEEGSYCAGVRDVE